MNCSTVSLPLAAVLLLVCFAGAGDCAEPFRLESIMRSPSSSTRTQHTNGVQLAQYEHSNGKPALQLRPPKSRAAGGNTYSIQRPASDYMSGGPPTVQGQRPPVTARQQTPQQPPVMAQAQPPTQHPLFTNQTSHTPARVIRRGTNAVRDMFRREKPQPAPARVPDPTNLSFDSGPVSPDLHVSAAKLMVQRGEIASAFQHYQSALRIDPRCRHALIGLARLQHRGGDLEGSIRTYRAALQRLGKDAVVCNDLGLCLARAGKYEEATQLLRTALAINPQSKMYRNNLAATYVESQRPNDALRVLEESYGPAIAQYNVGYLLQRRGALDEARSYFIRALRTDPSFEPARQMLESVETRISNRPADRGPSTRDFSQATPQSAGNETANPAPVPIDIATVSPSSVAPIPQAIERNESTNDSMVRLASVTEPVVKSHSEQPLRAVETDEIQRTPNSFLPAAPKQPLGIEAKVDPVISQPATPHAKRRSRSGDNDALIAPLPQPISFD